MTPRRDAATELLHDVIDAQVLRAEAIIHITGRAGHAELRDLYREKLALLAKMRAVLERTIRKEDAAE